VRAHAKGGMRIRIACKNQPEVTVPLKFEEALTIGREKSESDIAVDDQHVSRSHCAFHYEDNRWLIRDLKSRNGTLVNGRKITEDLEISPGDRITIGHTVITVEADRIQKGPQTVVKELEKEIGDGKGYSTMMKEIVGGSSD